MTDEILLNILTGHQKVACSIAVLGSEIIFLALGIGERLSIILDDNIATNAIGINLIVWLEKSFYGTWAIFC